MKKSGAKLVIGVGSLAVLILVSCSSLDHTVLVVPSVPDATFAGNRACYECHTNYVRSFASSPHARLQIEPGRTTDTAGCESCHGPGSKHVAAGGGRGRFIVNPGRNPAACFQCHLATQARFRLPQHHPVTEGKLNCVHCHDPHGQNILRPASSFSLGRNDESCAQCHREQTRPMVFAHEALRDGCTACHEPHGSVNAKMLRQPDGNLCLRCHAQVAAPSGKLVIGSLDHSTFVSRGTCWSSGCHTAIHGSSINPHLLY